MTKNNINCKHYIASKVDLPFEAPFHQSAFSSKRLFIKAPFHQNAFSSNQHEVCPFNINTIPEIGNLFIEPTLTGLIHQTYYKI
jgi:hypothetical protein